MKEPTHLSLQPQNGFLILLLSLVALQIIPPMFGVTVKSYLVGILITVVLTAALYLVVYSRKELVIGLFLGVPSVISNWWGGVLDYEVDVYVHYSLAIIYLTYISFHIGRYLFETTNVSANMLYAAVCLYMMLGIIWAMIYMIIEVYNPGSFKLSSNLNNTRLVFTEFNYFSYVTLATLGYGDIVPLTRIARSWSSLEAIVGQFYLAFVVARLVALQINSRNEQQ